MLTKEKIIVTAGKMFITGGVRNVTTRHIAKRIKISHGNLTYHYSNKDKIIEELFNRFNKDIDALFEQAVVSKNDFDKWVTLFFKFQNNYSYFFTDVVEISRKFPDTYFLLRNKVEMIQTHLKNLLYKVFKYRKDVVEQFSKQLILLPLTGFYFNDGKSLKELQKDWWDEVKLYKEPVQVIEKTKGKKGKNTQQNEKENIDDKKPIQTTLF